MREELKPENLSFADIAKRVGEMWQALPPDEKRIFEDRAGAAKEEYLAELARYKETDNYEKYAHYLADFKAKQSHKAGMYRAFPSYVIRKSNKFNAYFTCTCFQ